MLNDLVASKTNYHTAWKMTSNCHQKLQRKFRQLSIGNWKSNSFYYDFDIEIVFSVNDGHHRRFFGRVTQACLSTRLPWGACVSKNFHLHLGRAADWKGKSINFKEGGFKFRVQVWWQKAISKGVTMEAGRGAKWRQGKGGEMAILFQEITGLWDYGIIGLFGQYSVEVFRVAVAAKHHKCCNWNKAISFSTSHLVYGVRIRRSLSPKT